MKKAMTIAALLLAGSLAHAQQTEYFLPATVITVDVEAEQETFFAGPYASFAKRLLNIDVKKENDVTINVISATILPSTQADTKQCFSLEGEVPEAMALSAQGLISFGRNNESQSTSWRFLPGLSADFSQKGLSSDSKEVKKIVYRTVQTDTSEVKIPVEQVFKETKSLEDKAKEAADIILTARQTRMDIVTGNTDMNYSGQAMADALGELHSIEQEYLALFRGYSVKRTLRASFDVVPSSSQKSQKYLVFRTDPERGLVSNGRGTPYYIEFEPEALARESETSEDKKKSKTIQIHYRIPMVCRLVLTQDGAPLAETRVPVYQLGRQTTYPANN